MQVQLNIRRYKNNGNLHRVHFKEVVDFSAEKAKALAKGILASEELFGPPLNFIKLNPCNITIRGLNGRFIKWKN